jgi:hypothetical protein
MKRLLLILLILSLSAQALGADRICYVDATKIDDTGDCLSAANAKRTISTSLTYLATQAYASGHTLYVAPGSYTEAATLNNSSNFVNLQIIGVSNLATLTPAARDQIIITVSSTGVASTRSGQQYKNITLISSGTATAAMTHTGAGLIIDNCRLTGVGLGLSTNGATPTVTKSIIEGGGTNVLSLAGAGTFGYNIIRPIAADVSTVGYTLLTSGTGSQLFYNNTIVGGTVAPIRQSSASTLTASNNLLYSGTSTITANNAGIRSNEGGTFSLHNNHIVPSFYTGTAITGTPTASVDNITTQPARIITAPRSGFVIPCVDDLNGAALAYVLTLETELASRGKKGTWFIWAYGTAVGDDKLEANKVALQQMYARGIMTFGAHGYGHVRQSLTGNAFTITKADKTIDVNRTTDTISVSDTVTVTGFRAKSIATIVAELEGGGAAVGARVANLGDTTLGEILADSAGAQASPYITQILIDTTGATGLFNVEMVQAKAKIEAAIPGVTIRTQATPGGYNSTNTMTTLASLIPSGWWGSRAFIGETGATYLLGNIDLATQSYILATTITNASDAVTKANAYALAEMIATHGGIVYLLAHSTSEATIAQWRIILDALAEYPSIMVTDADTALNIIKNGGLWSTADSRTYTRTFTDQSDYHLLPGSPAINAGANLCATLVNSTDFAGRPVCVNSAYVGKGSAPEIGAYEYWPVTGDGGGWAYGFRAYNRNWSMW